jgi:ubiquitin C-terminal hydrolase
VITKTRLEQQDPLEFFKNFINKISESGHEIFQKTFNIECQNMFTCNKCNIPITGDFIRPTSLNLMPDQYNRSNLDVKGLIEEQLEPKLTSDICGRCNTSETTRKIIIHDCPAALVINLKRFEDMKISVPINVHDELGNEHKL